jgi:hypothetical protein
MRKRWVLIPLLAAGFLAFIALGGAVVQQLWNWLLPAIFGVRELTFWQAIGLLALCRILFGGLGGRGSHYRTRKSPEDWWKARAERMRESDRSAADGERAAAADRPGRC